MGLWFCLLACVCVYLFLQTLLGVIRNKRLPPSPPTIPILGNIFWLLKSSKNFADLEPVLRSLRSKYGNIVTIHIGSTPSIFITSHEAAHQALVKCGNVFAGRPMALPTTRIFFANQNTVSTSPYGPIWRMLRQNFMQTIQSSQLNSYSICRKRALNVFKEYILDEIEADNKAVPINDHFNYTMYVLSSYMCFGEKFDEETVKNIQRVQCNVIHNFIRFNVLNFLPSLNKFVFRRLWREILEIRHDQVSVLLPLIKARHEKIKSNVGNDGDEGEEAFEFEAYVDTLFDMKLPDSGNKLKDEELVSLCAEFMFGGTDTTAATWLWAMANLVKYQDIQEKLFDEIKEVVKPGEDIEEEHLKRMPYLKAVVLETLRRHPPGHFILPRAVTRDIVMDGYDIPKNAIVNFLVAELGWDPNVWEDPMDFKPERFLRHDDEGDSRFDIKGFREIKMMPFGAGRRVCPAINVAILHLEYFVANLVRDFKWTVEDGCEVDMSEKQTFTIGMKSPLRPCVSRRIA